MNLRDFAIHLSDLISVVLCVGIVLTILFYKKTNGLHKSIGCYFLLMLGVDTASVIVADRIGSNLIVLPVFSLIELLFFVYFYNKYLLSKPNKIVIGLGVLGMVYIATEFFQYFVFSTFNIKQFEPYAKITDNFIVIIMALIFYYQKMKSFNETWIINFKLNTAILLYFTINTIIFLPLNFILNSSGNAKFYIWIINVTIILLFYIYLTALIWKNGRRAITR